MSRFVAVREPVALQFMAANEGRFLRRGEFPPGIGPTVLDALVAKGHALIGPATSYPREVGYRISREGMAHLRARGGAAAGTRIAGADRPLARADASTPKA
jgi:hypothetical protein